MTYQFEFFLIFITLFVVLILVNAIRILREYERGVIFRLGRLINTKGPGLIILIPFIDKMVKISLRVHVMDIPSQDVITRDNVSIQVNAVLYFRVILANQAVVEVEDFMKATSQLAQTTLRSILGQFELDDLLAERDKINKQLQKIIDHSTEPWGIKVSAVEVKHIDLPQEMKRAMARQAEAERERRAKVIAADGEFQAANRLADAAEIMGKHASTIQLRYLQTLVEISGKTNTMTVFPIPIEFLKAFGVEKTGSA